MRRCAFAGFLTLIGMTAWADLPAEEAAVPETKLWAGLGVTSPIIEAEAVTQGEFFTVSFSLVNDGDENIDPKIRSSQFLINGKELSDWGFIVGNGPKDDRFESLPPGDCLRFAYAMGDDFAEPGVYTIQWKGEGFASAEVVFRVLERKER